MKLPELTILSVLATLGILLAIMAGALAIWWGGESPDDGGLALRGAAATAASVLWAVGSAALVGTLVLSGVKTLLEQR